MSWNDQDPEYQEFLRSTMQHASLSQDPVLHFVRKDLKNLPLRTLLKLSLVHTLAACISLAFCPQFGLSYFKSLGLMHYFMHLGHAACFILCGVFFMVVSLGCTIFILKQDELFYLKQKSTLVSTGLVALTVGFFWMTGPSFAFGSTALLWVIGSFLVLWPGLQRAYFIKSRLLAPQAT